MVLLHLYTPARNKHRLHPTYFQVISISTCHLQFGGKVGCCTFLVLEDVFHVGSQPPEKTSHTSMPLRS